jgi:hypothetical protein
VPEQNRVTPFGDIVAIDQRGMFMGNRGSIHRDRAIVRQWQVRRWITCALEFKGWVAPKWVPGRWTALFFWDEAVAIAAGHRPCALCRRADYEAWRDAWERAFGERPSADTMDVRLHRERLDGRTKRFARLPWAGLPRGSFVSVDDEPCLVLDDELLPWSETGYGPPLARPRRGDADVLTPAVSVSVLGAGYKPVVHP